ncbi:aspartate aminotransferase family protein [Prauserella muralis]|uniref:Adenosylmethionine-8-amino-7-oxononanoate aminotransferase n=1 Tax=Prauserella muralis TaxID=588067 RepID=A0A2V4BBZ3_9PSEU|nr:aspartate aminotransferase family protein [Prauserella muralis]PXY31569.1 adenosylmethionine-8-amino-7-oxononanoate aminotransferase [Prauserella muralis]TWE14074.1 adenosylmethionine-8-amino-7-oxononanoate aminotransferase [Prauserella muralis]
METRLWHPFANMAEVKDKPFLVDRAEGVWIYDTDGTRYLDGTAGLWYCNAGHGRAEIVDATAAQMRRLDSYFTFGDFSNEPAERLATRLSELAPMEQARIFFTTGGGESVDTAAKLARLYWARRGEPQRVHIVSRRHSYHGTNGFGTSLAGIEVNRDGFGPLLSDATRVAHDDAEDLRAAIERIGAENIAAFFAEPVIGAGGARPPEPGYLEAAAKICAEHGILFVADSVICGFGRVGGWFGVERWGLRPDLITFAKGVTSGYLPLGGVAAAGHVADVFWEAPGSLVAHGPTYSGHPTVAAAALANLDILEREDLPGRAVELERPLLEALLPLREHPAVADVRGGVGLIAAVELDGELLAEHKGIAARMQLAIRERGLIVRVLGGSTLVVSPPLIITEDEIGVLGKTMAEGIDAVLAG